MQTSLPFQSQFPPGFSLHPDFISKEEEETLLHAALAQELHSFVFQGYEARRRVASFGFDWSFETRTLKKGKEIPIEFHPLLKKVASFLNFDEQSFAELLITEYPVGSVINWHRDAPPFDIIAGLSLNSNCTFKFRPQEKEKQERRSTISVTLPRRSLYIIKGEARTNWQHSMAPVKELRYSITLRTLRS